jgi:predicted DNA-binding protein (UPF0251 family)
VTRNKKTRRIGHQPPVSLFKPAGVPARELEQVVLRLDEYEALRLADGEGMTQQQVAERLGVSRPTVSRILEKAHRTVARALTGGKALLIEGGPVVFQPGRGRGRRGRGAGPGRGPGGGQGGGRRRRRRGG